MQLFDTVERTETGLMENSVSLFEYTNRSARRPVAAIRGLLERWFSAFPEACRADLRGRFRSSIDSHHRAALFELYMHQLLVGLGFQVEQHPDIEGTSRHPDYLVQRDGKDLFFLEVTVVAPATEEVAAQARIDQVYDVLNRMPSPNFFLLIQCWGAPERPVSARSLRRRLEPWLKDLNPDDYTESEARGLDGLPSIGCSVEGWDLVFYALPKKADVRGRPGIRPIAALMPEMNVVDTHRRLCRAIRSKAGAYGALGLPYVIAVNVLEEFVLDVTIYNGLLGEEFVTIGTTPDGIVSTKAGRHANGAWHLPSGHRNTRVSAVLVASNLRPWNFASQTPRLFHNPWAAPRLQSTIWALPQVFFDRGERVVEGLDAGRILKLPAPWPPEDFD